MSVLLIDGGNSRLKWALCEHGEFLHQGLIAYQWPKLAAQFGEQWGGWLETAAVNKLVISNVAGDRLTSALKQWLAEIRIQELAIDNVTAQAQAFGVQCAYRQPAQLGADRWAALVAARHYVKGACCVIDCGTALTIDVLDADGVHAGGLIAPGISMMRESLLQNTAQIDTNEAVGSSLFSVRDTANAVQVGIMAATVGAVQQALQQCHQQGLDNFACVVTGGDAQALLPALPEESRYDADWVLKGLAIISGEHERTM